MKMTRYLSINVLLINLLVLLVISESTSFDGQRHPFPKQYKKRSIENSNTDWWHSDQPFAPSRDVDPSIKKQRKAHRIEESLPVLKTSCRQILCTSSPNYPKAAMTKVVDESRKILKSGIPNEIFENRKMDLQSFDSKIHDSEAPQTAHGRCLGNRKLTYPLEGYNRRHDKFFYIVNIPGFRQGVCTNVCRSNAGIYQFYTEEKLVVLPIGQRHFSIQDLKVRKIVVPHDCPRKVF